MESVPQELILEKGQRETYNTTGYYEGHRHIAYEPKFAGLEGIKNKDGPSVEREYPSICTVSFAKTISVSFTTDGPREVIFQIHTADKTLSASLDITITGKTRISSSCGIH